MAVFALEAEIRAGNEIPPLALLGRDPGWWEPASVELHHHLMRRGCAIPGRPVSRYACHLALHTEGWKVMKGCCIKTVWNSETNSTWSGHG